MKEGEDGRDHPKGGEERRGPSQQRGGMGRDEEVSERMEVSRVVYCKNKAVCCAAWFAELRQNSVPLQ